jgi:hypothetical protein
MERVRKNIIFCTALQLIAGHILDPLPFEFFPSRTFWFNQMYVVRSLRVINLGIVVDQWSEDLDRPGDLDHCLFQKFPRYYSSCR